MAKLTIKDLPLVRRNVFIRGPVDMKVDPQYGNVYWNEPDGHQWEMLTVSYARPAR